TAGLKTTYGRWPIEGIVPLSSSLDSPGLLARSVADLAFGFEAISTSFTGATSSCAALPSLKGVRIGIPENFFWSDCDDAITACIQASIRRLEAAGADVSAMTMHGCDTVYEI